MPRRNVFIRKEDIEAWDSMKGRPEWLHKCLSDYKNAYMGLDLTDTEFRKHTGEMKSPRSAQNEDPLPLIIAGIEDADD